MRYLLLLSFLVAATFCPEGSEGFTVVASLLVRNTSPCSREQALECVWKHVDGLIKDETGKIRMDEEDKDGCLDIVEVDHAKTLYLGRYISRAANLIESSETIMRNCDFDKDGCISANDFMMSNRTCVNDNLKRQLIRDYICSEAEQQSFRQRGRLH